MRHNYRWNGRAVSTVLFSTTALARRSPRRYAALVIGNGKCKESPVRNAVNEATDVVAVLRELARMAGVKDE